MHINILQISLYGRASKLKSPGRGGGIPYEKVGMLIGKFSRTELLEEINLDMT